MENEMESRIVQSLAVFTLHSGYLFKTTSILRLFLNKDFIVILAKFNYALKVMLWSAFNTYGSAIHCLEKILLQTSGTDSLIIWVEKKFN